MGSFFIFSRLLKQIQVIEGGVSWSVVKSGNGRPVSFGYSRDDIW